MTKEYPFHLDELPKGSRIEQLCNELRQTGIKDLDKVEAFLFKLFRSCYSYISEIGKPVFSPRIELKLIYQTELYHKMEKEKEQTSIIEEPSKSESYAFHVGNASRAQIFIDAGKLFSLLKYGYPTFVLNFVMTFFHEILHSSFLYLKNEQEIFDIECSLVEKFLGIELPEEVKKRMSKDYYEKSS
jgi:hypothetical protein